MPIQNGGGARTVSEERAERGWRLTFVNKCTPRVGNVSAMSRPSSPTMAWRAPDDPSALLTEAERRERGIGSREWENREVGREAGGT